MRRFILDVAILTVCLYVGFQIAGLYFGAAIGGFVGGLAIGLFLDKKTKGSDK